MPELVALMLWSVSLNGFTSVGRMDIAEAMNHGCAAMYENPTIYDNHPERRPYVINHHGVKSPVKCD